MTSAPKVLHVTTVDVSLDLLLLPQLQRLRDLGYDVETASAPGDHADKLIGLGFVHHPLRHATRSMSPVADLRLMAELTRLFRTVRPDIVHTHTPKPGWFGRPAARLARVPVVINTVHGLYATPDDSFARRSVVYALERFAAACSDAELLQSVEDKPILRKLRVPDDRLTILGNGIDLERFRATPELTEAGRALRSDLGISDDTVLVGAVGRLVWEKGLAELFEAAATLRRTHPQVQIVVVGPTEPSKSDGLTDDDLAEITETTGVRFLGARPDVEVAYSAFDLYALASYREGFPRSAMEAAAVGVPLIVTDIRGCRQVVDDGINGRLVPVRNSAALAQAIGSLADDADLRDRMGIASRIKAEADFDQERCVEITAATYERLVGR